MEFRKGCGKDLAFFLPPLSLVQNKLWNTIRTVRASSARVGPWLRCSVKRFYV